jgi:hypothetical protein
MALCLQFSVLFYITYTSLHVLLLPQNDKLSERLAVRGHYWVAEVWEDGIGTGRLPDQLRADRPQVGQPFKLMLKLQNQNNNWRSNCKIKTTTGAQTAKSKQQLTLKLQNQNNNWRSNCKIKTTTDATTPISVAIWHRQRKLTVQRKLCLTTHAQLRPQMQRKYIDVVISKPRISIFLLLTLQKTKKKNVLKIIFSK